jgi:branched-chain amino acid transport system substrate-binding protein
VLVIQSKSKDLRNESDVFEIISTEEPNEAGLRSCEELGHKA